MVVESDHDEEAKWIPLPDGRTICTHGNGTNQTRVIEAEPSEEAHVYDYPPGNVFVFPPLIPALMHAPKFQESYLGSCKYLIGSHCGRLFDRYFQQVIKEPTAYSANYGGEKDIPMLWPNRRLKLKFSRDCSSWAEGKVLMFKNWCAGPYSHCTRWYVEIQLVAEAEDGSDLKLGQLVEMYGLKAAKQYNGKYGVLTKDKNEEGRYTIVINSGKMLCIKPQNFSAVRTIMKEVHRMNISGGGVLEGLSNNLADAISFEWIDEAEPQWEPKIGTLEEDEHTLTFDLPPDELKSKQERLNQEFVARAPSLLGPPDVTVDGVPIDTPKRRAFQKYIKEEFGPKLFHLANNDLNGFEELLMTEPIGLWTHDELNEEMYDEVYNNSNPAAVKIMYAVFKHRYNAGGVETFARWSTGETTSRVHPADTVEYIYNYWQSRYAAFVGRGYRDPWRAIPWFQESVERTSSDDMLPDRLNYLANAYSKVGLLRKAFQLNRKACKYGCRSELPRVHEESDRLSKELKLWTGTSDSFVAEDGTSRISLEDIWGEDLADSDESDTNVVLLRPHTQVPPHFGAMDDEEYWEPVPVDLPRPLVLRSLPSSMSTFDDNDAKNIFMNIYNGNFQLKWFAGTRAELNREGVPIPSNLAAAVPSNLRSDSSKFLVLHAYADHGTDPVMTIHVMFIQTPRTNQLVTAKSTHTIEPYKSMFTIDQKNILSLRIIHWSVRLAGAKIDRSIEVYHLCNFLKQEYPKLSNWKDAVDASVIQTDFVHKHGKAGDILFYSLNGVGEAMEAAKSFEAAAKVYADSAKLFVSKGQYSNASTLFHNGGLAYRRCDAFENSESLYVSSLHYHLKSTGNNLNLNDDSFDLKLTNMFTNYDMWLNEKNGGTERIKTMHIVLSCLLYRSGFQARRGGRIEWAVKTGGQQMSALALNERCKTTKYCKKALRNAIVSSPLVSMFHTKILECKSAKLQSVSFTPGSNNGTTGVGGTKEKVAARDTMVSSIGSSHVHDLRQCYNVACARMMDEDEIKYCVCRKVSYCSKDCQRADWKVHKKICSTKQGKK